MGSLLYLLVEFAKRCMVSLCSVCAACSNARDSDTAKISNICLCQIWFWDVALLFCGYCWELFGSILKLRGALGDLFGSILRLGGPLGDHFDTILSPGGSLGDHFGLFERPGWLY